MVVYYLVLDWEGNGLWFAQNTTQTLIGGQLKALLAFLNVLAGRGCYVNKPTAHFTLDSFVVRRFVAIFVLL